MRFLRYHITFLMVSVTLLLLGSCSKVQEMGVHETEYGYVQFKLFKAASAPDVKASVSLKEELDSLSEVSKVRVTMSYNGVEIHQTLNLTAADDKSAEYGMRSDKIKLLAGEYTVDGFSLYNKLDQEIHIGEMSEEPLIIKVGGLTVYDLFANTVPRGQARFRFVKDMSDFENNPQSKASGTEYTFSDIAYVDLTVKNLDRNIVSSFSKLPVKFSIHFDEDDQTFGYQTSSLQADTLVNLIAGKYQVQSYATYDSGKDLYEINNNPAQSIFEVFDNKVADADVLVKLHETDAYLKDYYALYEIWKALDGENWSYGGENFPKGCNWNFNKDPDLWGDQPGVQIHSNGRVARVDLSEFGFKGKLPAAIGQLTELVELYLGTHNDVNMGYHDDPTLGGGMTSANRMQRHKEYLSKLHIPTQFSEPIARALKENNISIPEIAMYDEYTEAQLIDDNGRQRMSIRPMDMVYGKLTNGLTEIDPAIGKLTKLEMLYIANGKLSTLPAEFANLTSLTDLEIYNCPMMTKLPDCVGELPALISVNFSNNNWDAAASLDAFNLIANGKSQNRVQIFYFRENNLEEIPPSIRKMKSAGLLDFANNKIEKVAWFGPEIKPVQLYLNNNNLSSLPTEPEDSSIPNPTKGIFCGFEDIETFSVSGNKFTQFPDIFSSKSNFSMVSVDFSYNNITSIENDGNGYKGINVETLSITNNPGITKYPTAFAKSGSKINYINLRGCSIDEIPEGSFEGENVKYLNSLDLSYNRISDIPKEFNAVNVPYLYGLELSQNRFSKFPFEPFDMAGLTVFAIRAQRDENGKRCLKEWPTGMFQHTGLRGFYIGSNDIGKVEDTISHLIYYLDISDNPNIEFDASDICYYYAMGAYILIYDKTQNITGCEYI